MGSATTRRFALVAALVALATVGLRPVATATGTAAAALDAAAARLVAPAPGPAPAIRRQANARSWLQATRPLGRGLLALAVTAALVMLGLARWATLAPVPAAASSLVRRRHVITLRAPPVPLLHLSGRF